jgi:hypothetical protein
MPAVLRLMREERVALFVTEMGNVYDGSGVGGNELQGLAGFEALEALARLQHRKRAKETRRVEFMVPGRTI